MKLKCIKDTETVLSGMLFSRTSKEEKIEGITEGKVYDGEFVAMNINERNSFIYFFAFDDDNEWTLFNPDSFIPARDL